MISNKAGKNNHNHNLLITCHMPGSEIKFPV